MQTSGRDARDDATWTARASTSLPTPVSPEISTLMSPAAARSASACTRRMLSSTQAIVSAAPSPRTARDSPRARAPRAGEQRARVAPVVGIAGDAGARRPRAVRRAVARTPPPGRGRCRRRVPAAASRTPRDRSGRARRSSAGRRRPRSHRQAPGRGLTENVPPVASARAHSHSTRPSNSACESTRARAVARADRLGWTISTSEPIAIASPGSTRRRAPGSSRRS